MRPLDIYILDDDAASITVLTEMLGVGFPGAKLHPFTDHRQFLAVEALCRGDLFIIDICLTGIDGRELPAMMPAACQLKPFLFVSGYPIRDEDFDALEGLVVFDFIGKPFALRQFLHRVGLLMDASPLAAPFDDTFDLMVHAPFVAVVLDEDLIVKYCNQQTAVLLEKQSAAEVVGCHWLEFVPEEEAVTVAQVHATVLRGDLRYSGEFVNLIKGASGRVKRVRWFNSPFEGSEGQALTLSVGVPSQMEPTVTEKIRRLWGERIQRDKKKINAVKPLAPTMIETCRLEP